MPAEVEFRPEGGYVYMRVVGEINTKTAMGMISQWMMLEREHTCRKVLTDYRESVLSESITGMYDFVGKMDDLGIPRDMQMACVARPGSDDHVFFETVARNQGWRYQLFSEIAEARAWLVED